MVEDPDGNWGEHEGSWLSIWFGDRDMGWGYGFRCPTTDFINAFEPGDNRLDASVVFDGESTLVFLAELLMILLVVAGILQLGLWVKNI